MILDNIGRQHRGKPEIADGVAKPVVVGQLVTDPSEPADPPQYRAAQRNRRAETAASDAQHVAEECARQESEIDVHRTELRPQPAMRHTLIEAGYQPDPRILERGGYRTEIIRLDAHVAVGEDQNLVPRRG